MHRLGVLHAWSLQPNSPFIYVSSNLTDAPVFLSVQWAQGHLRRALRGYWGSCIVSGQPVPGMKQVPSQQPRGHLEFVVTLSLWAVLNNS